MRFSRVGHTFGLVGFLTIGIASCGPHDTSLQNRAASRSGSKVEDFNTANFVRGGELQTNRVIGDHTYQFMVVPVDTATGQDINSIDQTSETETPKRNRDLVIGIPSKLLDQPMLFGTTLTKVSEPNDESLGSLKMAAIPPIRVVMKLREQRNGAKTIEIVKCAGNCKEGSRKETILEIPVVDNNPSAGSTTPTANDGKFYYLNLAELGQKINIEGFQDREPILTRYEAAQSKTISVDYSKSTLVFDVATDLAKKTEIEGPMIPNRFTIVTRWFIRPSPPQPSDFVPRKAIPEVGFFTADQSRETLIEYWNLRSPDAANGIKYYIKNVPSKYHGAFSAAFDEWNEKLKPILDVRVFDYEFISDDDARYPLIVAGDPRYNVIEWDLENNARYGGLGPSIADPDTGEIFQATVLVQGPKIMKGYTDWYMQSQKAKDLRAANRTAEADHTIFDFYQSIAEEETDGRQFSKLRVALGDQIEMRVRAQEPPYQDPLMSPYELDEFPDGYEFQDYMNGYFQDMLAHELGHNLGMRHNFKGNLGARDGAPKLSGVSRSVMEYLGKSYRYLDRIGEYDLMAIAYGYRGILPEHSDWYCTDENAAGLQLPYNSAECTSRDATNDPFEYFMGRLERLTAAVIGKGKKDTPALKLRPLIAMAHPILSGIGTYPVSSVETGSTWTQFFDRPGRPQTPKQVSAYVLQRLKGVLCNPDLDRDVQAKSYEHDRVNAKEALDRFRIAAQVILRPVFEEQSLACESTGGNAGSWPIM